MRKKCLNILLIVLLIFMPHAVKGATLSIPVQYASPNAAAADAKDGDVILIEAGEYTGSGIVATWYQNNLTIRGVNGRAHLNASGVSISNGKAIWVIGGSNVVIENIEFSNADVPDNNGAGIRYEGSSSLSLINCYFHDNEMGILTGNLGTEDITIESCEFRDHGKSNNGFSHNIYIGRGAKFTMIKSYSHDAYEGHNVKSRADENYILYNRIIDHNDSSSDKASSYLIDLPEGGLSYIIGNELHQSPKAANTTAISYARENTNNPLQILYFNNNTIVNDRNNGIALNIGGNPTGQIVNNIFDNFTTIRNGSFSGTYSNNEKNVTFVNRDNIEYRLQSGSNGINSGIDPGSGNGFNLTPVNEYVHPLQMQTRYSDGQLDVGAFEFKEATTNNNLILPILLLLL
ncbi:MAG: right-handed parallel beta-helix repeat-containing protein [Desulfobacterales bacterium]|nr:right-handed parallel beta-helix repeat-containing protein [Desulfobacterales bacterium]